ncbi:MAG: M23 family metallopeptidase, partial [Deltaproteobacteria bacterium]
MGALAGAGRAAAALLVGAAVCAIDACASDPPRRRGVYHTVKPGETVWRISKRYGVTTDAVVRANRIRDVTEVPTGARLWIPGAGKPRPVYPPPPASNPKRPVAVATVPRAEGGARALEETDLKFRWPLRAPVSSGFGWREGRAHQGVDIPAPRGTSVHAAEAGRVIYSGNGMRDYGNVVIVKHVGYYATVYAHNRRNRVQEGAFVEKGQVIAEVGKTGNASRPHLHFEIRRGARALDP